MRTRFPVPPGPVLVSVNVQWKTASQELRPSSFDSCVTSSIATNKNPLLHICDLYDAALCLRVLWILHHCHVQFFLAFAEGDVCCAITSRNLKYVEKLAVGRYL